MKFTLTFTADNAAFADDWQSETFRILTRIAERIQSGDNSGTIRDSNGNHVGSFKFEA